MIRKTDDEKLSVLFLKTSVDSHVTLWFILRLIPLKDIKKILDSPDFDRNKALEQQMKRCRHR